MKKIIPKNSRLEILEATKRLFCAGNFSPSMAEIAAESRISKSALYYFFQDKKDLFVAVSEVIIFEFTHELEKIAAQQKTADKKMKDFFAFFFQEIEKKKTFSQMVIPQIFSGDVFFLKIISEKRRAAMITLSDILLEGQKTGIFRDFSADAIAEAIGGILDFLLIFRAIVPDENSSEKCLLCHPQKIVDEFLHLLQK